MPKKATQAKPAAKRTPKRVIKKPAAPKKLPRPPVPGLLPVPPEVLEFVESEIKDHPVYPTERQRLLNLGTLQYFYGGESVVYRNTPQGVEILAVGDDITGFYRSLPPGAARNCTLGVPDLW